MTKDEHKLLLVLLLHGGTISFETYNQICEENSIRNTQCETAGWITIDDDHCIRITQKGKAAVLRYKDK